MKVEELIKRLRRFPKDAEVFILPDELECDDEGFFTDLQVRGFSRDSNRRRRGGEEKRKSGPPKGCKFTKQDFTERPVPTKEPVKAERLCQQCVNWPCFAGIENLETDFAKEGCHGWFPRAEVV